MCTDYPHAWPHVFAQLLSFLPNGPVAIDLFLRVLNTVHEEVRLTLSLSLALAPCTRRVGLP